MFITIELKIGQNYEGSLLLFQNLEKMLLFWKKLHSSYIENDLQLTKLFYTEQLVFENVTQTFLRYLLISIR